MTDQSTHSMHDSGEDPRNDTVLVYVNGDLVPRPDAKVSVYDSGFMLGDGIWEGLRLKKGCLVFLDEHLDRLYEAAISLDLDIGMDRKALTKALYDTVKANGMVDDAHVRLMVTRGVKRKPFQDPRFSIFGSTIVMIAEHSALGPDWAKKGARLHTVPNHRGLPLTQDPKLNSHSKLNCILALVHALKAGADEALMLDPFGFVNTTNACNFFIVRGGEVWTSTGDYCMNGITRRKVIELCRANDIPVFERNFSLLETYGADEAFMSGTFGGPTPVGEIDGRTIGDGNAGPVLRRIRKLYGDLVETHIASVTGQTA